MLGHIFGKLILRSDRVAGIKTTAGADRRFTNNAVS